MKTVEKFYVDCPGEKDAGLHPASALVEFSVPADDAEYVDFVKDRIKQCFIEIWGETRVSVMTDLELQARDKAENDHE